MLHIPCDRLRNFDYELQEIYFDIASKETELNQDNVPLLKKSIEELTDALNENEKKSCSMYNSPLRRCAYMFKHAPCVTSALSQHLQKLLRHNLHAMFNESEFNICCLGGGPGTEVVALSKLLSSIKDHFKDDYDGRIKLRITIVDNNEDWEGVIENIHETLKRFPHIFKVEKLQLELRFVNADITFSGNFEILDAMKNADIVFMVFLLCDFPVKTFMKNMEPIQELLNCMKDGALLFYLDSSLGLLYEIMDFVVQRSEGMKPFYGPHLNQIHIMSLDSMKKHIQLCWNKFNQIVCQPHCNFSVCAWIKTQKFTMLRSVRSHSIGSKKDVMLIEKRNKEILKQIQLKAKELDASIRIAQERKLLQFQWSYQKFIPKAKSANTRRNSQDKTGMNEYYQDASILEECFELSECFDNLYFQAKAKNKRKFTL